MQSKINNEQTKYFETKKKMYVIVPVNWGSFRTRSI